MIFLVLLLLGHPDFYVVVTGIHYQILKSNASSFLDVAVAEIK